MKNLGWLLLAVVLSVSFIPLREVMPPSYSGHIQATVGRKAWLSFNDLNQVQFTRITKFGFNKDVDSAAAEGLVSFGGSSTAQIGLAAETLSVVSTDADDTSAGTGARTLLIQCITSDGTQSDVSVTMNGTTPVVTVATCKFINRVIVLTSGSSDRNEGAINITQSTSGVQLAQIPANKSVTQQLMYYVPSDRSCYIEDLVVRARKLAGGTAPRVEFNVLTYSQTQDTLYDIREYFVDTSIENEIKAQDFKAERLRPNEIIVIDIITNTNDTVTTGSFELTCKIDM